MTNNPFRLTLAAVIFFASVAQLGSIGSEGARRAASLTITITLA